MKKIFSLLSAVLVCMAANAQVNLADAIKSAQANAKVQVAEGNTDYEVAPVTLTESNTYVLDSYVDLGTQNAVIFGGGAKVIVKGEGQIATSSYLKIYGVNFDLSEATIAPIAMSKTPDEALKLKDKFPGANQDMFYNLDAITIDHCAFSNVATSVITANGNNWALFKVNFLNSIIQIADGSQKNVFDFKGSIKNLEVSGNTIYSIAAGGFTKSVFYLGNGSNAQPQKAWGTDATASFVVTNNTMANLVKNFADQWPSRNNVIVTAKNNIFYNVFRFQNKFVGNGTKDYTADDNIQYSDLASSTVENGLGVVGNPEIKVPTTALDFNNIAVLKNYFAPVVGAYPMGDPRWSAVFYAAELEEGQQSQVIKLSNAITTATKDGSVKKVIDVASYPWLKYVNASSVCDNGQYELSCGGHYASIDYRTGEPTTGKSYAFPWGDPTADFEYIAPDVNPSSNYGSPKIEIGYTKDEAENLILKPKHMDIDVKNAAGITLYLTGGGSKPNAADIIVKNLTTKEIKVYTTGEMANKSNKAAAANTNSIKYDVTLDPANSYEVSVYPAASYSHVKVATTDEFGDVVKVDQTLPTWVADTTYVVAGLGDVPAVFLYAVQLTAPEKAPICHEPGAKYAGTNYEVVKFSNYITTAKKGDADKNVLDEVNNPWMKYVNLSSVCDNGQYELSKGGHWASIDYVTGNPTAGGNWAYIPAWGSETTADFEYIFPDANPTSNLGSPKAEMGYTKPESDLILQPKSLSISVKNTTKVELFLTGAGSNTNAADIIVKDAATGVVEKVITTDVMAGKSNKAAAANTNSIKVAIDLKASKRYTISVFPSAQYTQVEMASVDEFGDAVKAYVPFTGNWVSSTTYTAAGLSNVKAPAVFVYAAHIYGTDLSVAPVASDALTTGISNVETQRVAPKKYINANGQIVIGNYNIAGQRVK